MKAQMESIMGINSCKIVLNHFYQPRELVQPKLVTGLFE